MFDKNKKVLGVIGGLGPIATAHFMELVIQMTEAETDQENLDMIIYNFPCIPDRTAYILDSNNESPLPAMIKIGRALAEQGADHIAIPCITAHYFCKQLNEGVGLPIISGVAETVTHLKEQGITTAGIMATDGTISSEIFTKELQAVGIKPIIPSKERQKDVMHLIYKNVKANKSVEMDRFFAVRDELCAQGSQAIILGCTELSIIKRDYPIGANFIDAMEVLARQSLVRCGKTIKPEYINLITEV